MIAWRGQSCFWWYRDQILCSSPDDAQLMKLVQMARALNAYAVGDDGERYEIKKGFLGKEKLGALSMPNPSVTPRLVVIAGSSSVACR